MDGGVSVNLINSTQTQFLPAQYENPVRVLGCLCVFECGCVCVCVFACIENKLQAVDVQEFSTCTCQLPLEAINCEEHFRLQLHQQHQLRMRQLPQWVSLKLTTAATATKAVYMCIYLCMYGCVWVCITFTNSANWSPLID